jgi:hypothetical protein
MRARAYTRQLAAALAGAAALALSAFAAIALGDVIIYSNPLTTQGDGNELHHFEGKGKNCARRVRKGSLIIQVTGKDICGYRLPLEGDRPQPNYALHARVKLGQQTPKRLRKKSFVGVAIRYGGGSGYTLRLLPTRHQFALRRLPKSSGFNVARRDSKVKGLNKWNDIRLLANGTRIAAFVNGKKVANTTDPGATSVKGRKAEVFTGANKANATGAFGRVDDVRLSVPSP